MKRILCILLCLMCCACQGKPVEKVLSTIDTCRVTNYDMDLVLDTKNHQLSGTVTMEILNETEDVIQDLCLRNYAMAYLEEAGTSIFESAYIEGEDTALVMNVQEDQTVIFLSLDTHPIAPDDSITISVKFKTDIPSDDARFSYIKDTKGHLYQLTNCFPILSMYQDGQWDQSPTLTVTGESNFNKVTDYHVTLTVPHNYVVVASGNETKTETGYIIEGKDIREMAIVACDFMKVNTQTTTQGIDVNHYYLDVGNNETFQEISLQAGVESMELFTEFVGSYPYEEMDIVEAYLSGGMEFPGLVFIGSSYFENTEMPLDNVVNYSQVCRVVSHEVGHQWFYNTVGSHPYIEPWLDEGLTSFLETMYLRSDLPTVKKATQLDLDRGLRTSKNGYTDEEYEEQIALQKEFVMNFGFSIANGYDELGEHYSYTIYQGGNCFLWELKNVMGSENFSQMLQDYYTTYYFKEATTNDFLNILRSHNNSSKVNQLIKEYIEK